MKYASIALAALIGIMLLGMVVMPTAVRAHEQETSVDWEVAYANIQTVTAPVYSHYTNQTLPLGGPHFDYSGVETSQGYRTIPDSSIGDTKLSTGDYIRIDWGFHYVGQGRAGSPIRGDIFWITRLGLDFGTVGRYIDGKWIGSGSFELVPNAFYNATLVLRSIQPTLRHLHVGVSVQDVGNIPAAPTLSSIPPGGPILYGVFTRASGPVAEPLGGMTIPPFGELTLIATWPWAAASLAAQIVIGFAFIGIMWWYGRWESKRGAKA
jgi:hypothetical protein